MQQKILHSINNRHREIVCTSLPNVVVERSLLSAREVFIPVNRELHPHPGWQNVEDEYTKRITQNEQHAKENGITIVRIALDCDFPAVAKRIMKRGDPDACAAAGYHKKFFDASRIFHKKYCDYIIPVDTRFTEKECIDNVYVKIKQNME